MNSYLFVRSGFRYKSNNLLAVSQNVHRTNTRLLASSQGHVKSYESIPGLSSLPLIGPLHHFLPVIGTMEPPKDYVHMLELFHKKFGPVVRIDGFRKRSSMLILFEPEHYEQVYRAEEVSPTRPGFDSIGYYRKTLRKDTHAGVYGLTATQGAQWREFRSKVNPVLLKLKMLKGCTPGLEEIAREMVARLTALSPEYLQNNFDAEMAKYSLESAGFVGLGARIGCLQDNITEDHPARKLMQSIKDVTEIGLKLQMNPIQLWRYFSTSAFKKVVTALDFQWEISVKYVEQAKQKINERGHDIPEEEKSVIEKLLAIEEKVAIMMANEMLMAGIDTVAFATTALLYKLAVNQKVQDTLRAECHLGASKTYLKACLKEALRLHPVTSANLRRTSREHVVAGYHIPKGIDVIAPNEYLTKMEKHYLKPTEFIPERWLTDKTDPLYYGNAHPMVTLPFGFGVRMCIGRRVAEMEIENLVQNLVRDYVIKWDGPPLKIVTSVTVKTFEKPFCFKFEAIK